MASSSGSEKIEPAGAGGTDTGLSNDPDVLAADIEKTREELAETFDAIVDKVSPKRVAQRTSEKVAEVVKEGVATTREKVAEGTATAREIVAERTATAREKVAAVSDRSGSHDVDATAVAPVVPVVPVEPPLDAQPTALPPAGGVAVPHLAPPLGAEAGRATPATSGSARLAQAGSQVSAYTSQLPVRPEVLAGAAAALVAAVLLVVRSRR